MNDNTASARASPDWRKILGWLALAFVVTEVVSAFFIEFPAAAIVFAALFLAGWFLLRRGGRWGVILVGVLCLLELAGLPFYKREDADDWIVQGVALALGVVGLVAAAGALWRRPADGKEGVGGSSPPEGLPEVPAIRHFSLSGR